MKKLFTFLLLLYVYVVSAQTTIYTQTFNGTYTDWTLNTTDLGGDASKMDNQWIVNSSYAGGLLGSPTADEPSGITGFPESNYMHIYSLTGVIFYGTNCNFNATGTDTYFAGMNTSISTTGYTGVSFSFWWLCNGDANAYGKAYYRTVSGGTWLPLPGGLAKYNLSSTWANQVITNVAFDNQAFLEFGFQFTEDMSGNDPAFAVDEIKVSGTMSSTVAPVASFTTSPTPATACTDSCITVTSTSTISSGSIDSIRWVGVYLGFPVLLGNTNPYSYCATPPYNVPGTYTLRLRVYGNGKADSSSGTITINPAPSPVITKSGKKLSVATTYTSYQWSNGSGIIAGATNASYTYTVSGTYSVTVDSGGCPGTSAVFSTAQVSMINAADNYFWLAQSGSPAIMLHATQPLEEPLTINIYDIAGRRMINDTWSKGSDMKQIDGSLLPRALYIIRLSNTSTSTVLRWTK